MVRPDDQPFQPSTVMLIRHGEKPMHNARLPYARSPQGVTPNGKRDPQSLTVYGWVRAGALIELFAPSWGEPPAGLCRPDTIYAASFAGGHSKRAVETVFPLAARLGLKVVQRFGHGDEKHLAQQLNAVPGAAVVSWHHEGIPKIVKHLGEIGPTPPAEWPSDRYDMVWVFNRVETGWRFLQVPQLLVPGDSAYPIVDDDETEANDEAADATRDARSG